MIHPDADITNMLRAWSGGDAEAFQKLTPLVYEELRRIAGRYMRQENQGISLQTTALVNEAYIRLIDAAGIDWRDRAHFFAVSAQMMRRILVDAARARGAGKRGGDAQRLDLNESIDGVVLRDSKLLELDETMEALARFDRRKAQVVEMRFFGGLSNEEIAQVLKISPQSVMRDWRLARAWLHQEMSR